MIHHYGDEPRWADLLIGHGNCHCLLLHKCKKPNLMTSSPEITYANSQGSYCGYTCMNYKLYTKIMSWRSCVWLLFMHGLYLKLPQPHTVATEVFTACEQLAVEDL